MPPQHFPMKLRRFMALKGLFAWLKAIFRLSLPSQMNSRNTLVIPLFEAIHPSVYSIKRPRGQGAQKTMCAASWRLRHPIQAIQFQPADAVTRITLREDHFRLRDAVRKLFSASWTARSF